MPYCPNPDCSFRKRFGESAEYKDGTATCSDCGANLVADDQLGPVAKEKKKFRIRDVCKRILWTLALLGFWRILSHFPLLGIDSQIMERWGKVAADMGGLRYSSLFALGLMPYITAYIIIALLSLLIQPFKRWRLADGELGRTRLVRASRLLTLVIAVFQGCALVGGMSMMAGGELLVDNGLWFRSLMVLTLVAGVFLLVWLADLISAKGCGHGVSLLFLVGDVGGALHTFEEMLRLHKGAIISAPFVMPLVVLAGVFVLILYIERSTRLVPMRYEDGTESSFPVKITAAGIVPVSFAGIALSVPILFVPFNVSFDAASNPVATWITQNLYPGAVVYIASSAVLTFLFYFILTALFFNYREISDYLGERKAAFTAEGEYGKRHFNRGLEGMAAVGGLYLVLLPLLLPFVWSLFQPGINVIDGISLITSVCIALDLTNELRFRWHLDAVVPVAVFSEPWKVGLFRSLLEKEGIASVTRGYYHRSLLYLFGPYIEMTVYVAADKAGTAQEMERRFINPGTVDGLNL